MSTVVEAPTMHVCADCGKAREKPVKRLPRGWKRLGEAEHCDDCWGKRYILRSISMPVVSPLDQTWEEFRASLKEMWILTTQASNWMLTEMFARDVRRGVAIRSETLLPGDEIPTGYRQVSGGRIVAEDKMPPMPKVYLYPETTMLFPGLPTQTAAALEQAVKKKYMSKRYEVVWIFMASLPTYRYPAPFPVPAQGWRLSFEEVDGKDRVLKDVPIVSVRIGDQRVRLRLMGGPRYHRQMNFLRQIHAEEAVAGELALYQRGDNLMCKMATWLPRAPSKGKREREGTLFVRTDENALLIALDVKDDKLWEYHGRQVQQADAEYRKLHRVPEDLPVVEWSETHRKRLQEWSDDTKFEDRPTPAFAEKRELAARRYRGRMDTVCHESAARCVGYAVRRSFRTIRYNDADQKFCAGFPWFQLREQLKQKCEAEGVLFEHVTSSDKPTETA